MLSQGTLNLYRRMSLGEKLALVLQLIREVTPNLFKGTPEEVRDRFEQMRRENDEASRAVLEGLGRARARESRYEDGSSA
jgi:hypothetical protein